MMMGVRCGNLKICWRCFVIFFSRIATDLDNDIHRSSTDPLSYLPPRADRSFFAKHATIDEINKIIMLLPNKGCDINAIPIFIYKKLSMYLSPVICDLNQINLVFVLTTTLQTRYFSLLIIVAIRWIRKSILLLFFSIFQKHSIR